MSPHARYAYALGRSGYRLDHKWKDGLGRTHAIYVPRQWQGVLWSERRTVMPRELELSLLIPARMEPRFIECIEQTPRVEA